MLLAMTKNIPNFHYKYQKIILKKLLIYYLLQMKITIIIAGYKMLMT